MINTVFSLKTPFRSPSMRWILLTRDNYGCAQISYTYPPKILLTISPRPVQGKPPDGYCSIGVNGIIEDHGKFTLHFPSHPSSDPVHVPLDQQKGKCIHTWSAKVSVHMYSSVLARPLPKGTVPFGLLMCPLWSGLKAQCALCQPLHVYYFLATT